MLSRDVRGPWAERPFVGDTRTLGDCTVAAFTECRPRCTVVLLQPMAVSTAAHFRLRRAAAIPNQDPLPLVFPWPIESLAIGETAGRCHRRALEFSRKKKEKKVVPRLQTEREKKTKRRRFRIKFNASPKDRLVVARRMRTRSPADGHVMPTSFIHLNFC